MQHTKLDRWLCKKFVHINQIYFNTMPESFPRWLDIAEAGAESGARYRYRITIRSEELTQEVCDTLAAQNITYTARIDQRNTLFARFVGNPKRSVTMLMVWLGLSLLWVLFVFTGVTQTAISTLMQDRDEVKARDELRRDERMKILE